MTIDWAHFTPWASLAGGVLIGIAAAMLVLLNGRIAGISGIIGGLLVGFGTRYGSGCTSGHGVCGISRGAGRSFAATATFMTFGFFTVFLLKHL